MAITSGRYEELDLVLLVHLAVEGEVADLGVGVLDVAADLGDELHGFGTECLYLGEGGRLVVTALILRGEAAVVVIDDVELQLAHGLEGVACSLLELLVSLAEGVLGRALQGQSVLGEIGTEQSEGGNLGERIEVGRRETGNDVKVARAGLDVGEEAGTVHSFSEREDQVEVLKAADREVEGLEPAVSCDVAEVYDADSVVGNVLDYVLLGELVGCLADGVDQGVDVVLQDVVVHKKMFLLL